MKTSFITAFLLPLLALAAPAQEGYSDAPANIQVTARHPGREHVDKLPMQAAGRAFWLGGTPATYCPEIVGAGCPPGNATVILGLNSMSVLVPGGQQLYVEPSGKLGFTQAHSASIPEGSHIGGFAYKRIGKKTGSFYFAGWGATALMACPVPNSMFYQVFANIKNAMVPGGDIKQCVEFIGVAEAYDGRVPAAWQYT
ncbi:IgE-binding protein [Arthroderma uncinatum]|uniref:IgE-binding protein n=1 Tax=Arthroderma uncinatum TaxID=74035 RepID=UPI00144A602A|nr:IgE-binding protein [Arthroderma uncinatum]KAF3490684.1 IgE-binding protein [Arthroderma uncinatum]